MSRNNNYSDNYDFVQKGPLPIEDKPSILKEVIQDVRDTLVMIKRLFYTLLKLFKRIVAGPLYRNLMPYRYYSRIAPQFSEVSYLYDRLADEISKSLLVDLFAYRVLGFTKVKLSRNNPRYWKDIEDVNTYVTNEKPIQVEFMNTKLPLFDLRGLGYEVRTHAAACSVACAFVQKQYEFHRNGVHIKAEAGDVAIDAGGCWGETTMYFAHEVGKTGEVYSFEFIPSNLAVMYQNIKKNPHLADRVHLVESPIWTESNKRLYYVDWGPGSNVNTEKLRDTYVECFTKSIDDLVEEKNIRSVDFIKMDIEGAELPALKGAEKAILKFKPKLAISVYHQLSDFTTIPKYLDSLGLDFEYYLDHHTIHTGETVLFALPAARRNSAI